MREKIVLAIIAIVTACAVTPAFGADEAVKATLQPEFVTA